ncbi:MULTISPECIES: DUF4192 domain-containing protein [Nocardia]|uniref:DUF4192 domain-containing protein n=1 Tax=Nocardia TaxID=1817 RepID=UPI000685031A|nr:MULTISPECIES: DUF4192 domain-containing protein [Nocardia]
MSTPIPFPSASRLIASVPGIIGFLPQRSLILILIPATTDPGHDEPAALPHFDLTEDPASITDRLAPLLTTLGPAIGYVLVIDDRLHPPHHDPTTTTTGQIRHHRLVEHVVRALTDSSVRWQGSFATTAIVAGGVWWSLSGPADSGTLPDPAHSPFARERAALGVPVLASRTALADSLATDPALAEQVSAALPQALADVHGRRAGIAHAEAISDQDRRDLEAVLYAIADHAAGEEFTAGRLARLGAALGIPAVERCLPATAAGAHAVAAEGLWVLLTRSLTGPHRAHPAVLLARSAHLRGDGVLARIAVTTALEADPADLYARLLYAVIERGLPPRALNRLTRSATTAAADLGITIG